MKRLAMILLCGWVLWTEAVYFHTGKRPTDNRFWNIVDAYETKSECQLDLDLRIKMAIADGEKAGRKVASKGRLLNEEFEGTFIRTTFSCLPGGTDPRPRYKE